MKDRVSRNPGRVLVTPENGDAAFYATIRRADNPTVEGDAINKQNLLPDSVAQKLGLDPADNPVPADAFYILAEGMGKDRIVAFDVTDTETSTRIISTFEDGSQETTIVQFTTDGYATKVTVDGVDIPVSWVVN